MTDSEPTSLVLSLMSGSLFWALTGYMDGASWHVFGEGSGRNLGPFLYICQDGLRPLVSGTAEPQR